MKTYNSVESPFIVKVFEASTGHITKEDDKLLRRDDVGSVCTYDIKGGKILYGYLVFTGLENNSSIKEEIATEELEAMKADGFSDAFINLLKIARAKGCKFLQLDGDGVSYEDLPTFEW